MPPWPSPPTPGTLPPYPGPGWCADTPVTTTVANRAAYWNAQLWDYPTKTQRRAFVQEQFGGQWLTFAAAWHPGTAGPKTYMATEAYRLCTAPPVAPSTPVTPATPAPAPAMAKPSPVGPSPGPGTWQTNAPFISRYQAALTWLSQQGAPSFNPQGIDGKFGPNTSNAVKAFQQAHGLSPVDGEVGPATAAALDTAMGYTAVMPPSPAPAPAAAPTAAPPAAAPFVGPPPLVLPYPGTGAWQSNAPYVQRYQAALTWLSQALNSPAYDPHGIDGKFGPNTSNAVKAFQQAHGIAPVDGEAGPATAAAIDAAVAATGGHG
ncbi:MAG: peptidoglycan-binding protein [Chloroflexota bacterium]|nr:peptidoglycan-binding protein [Chloroflexota bacterium]